MIGGKANSATRPTALGTMLQASTYGMTIPTIFGLTRSAPLVIWANNLREGDSDKKGKKKGVTTYVEDIDFLLGSNPIRGVLQMWGNNSQKYPLNLVKLRINPHFNQSQFTIPDPNFYFLIAMTAEVTLTTTFNDYGGTGPQTIGPAVYEAPLWNAVQHGPDLTEAAGAKYYPFVYAWRPGTPTIDLLYVKLFQAPANGIPNGNGFFNLYYAQLSSVIGNVPPLSKLRLTFESQLGNGPEYTDFPAQQIIYPYYAGVGSPNIDLGAGGFIPDLKMEVAGAHSIYPSGDCDFVDMIEDTLKSGMIQVGTQLGEIQRGLNLNDLPGPVQMACHADLEPTDGVLTYQQPNAAGGVLVGVSQWRPTVSGSAPTISDDAVNAWIQDYTQIGDLYFSVWHAIAVAADAGNVVRMVDHGGGFAYDNRSYIFEMDPSVSQVNTTNTSGTTAGPFGNITKVTGSIDVGAGPAYILAILVSVTGFINAAPLRETGWNPIAPLDPVPPPLSGGTTFIFGKKIAYPGTYLFEPRMYGGAPYTIVMMAFTPSQAPSYPQTYQNILDPVTRELTRNQCRATGLQGSATLDSQKKGADWLADFFYCANAAPVWSGFMLKCIPRSEVSAVGQGAVYISPTASGPVADIPESALIGDGKNPAVKVIRKTPGVDSPTIAAIEFVDRQNAYNPSVATWPEPGAVTFFGPRKQAPKVLHEIQDPVVARKLLAIETRRMAYIEPITYQWTMQAKLQMLEAMDLVRITDTQLGIFQLPVRLTSVVEDDKFNLKCEAEPFIYAAHAPNDLIATPSAPFVPDSTQSAGNVNAPIFLEPTSRLSGQTTAQLWIVVSSPSPIYGGSVVYFSTSGSSFAPIGRITGNSVTGVTTADWPANADPDITNDLPLDLTESLGSLQSLQVADEDSFAFPCYIQGGTTSIPYGLMTYAVAQLTAANHYTLKATGGNKLRRCVFNVPQPSPDVDHPLGSRWALLNPLGIGIFKVNLDPTWIGKTLHFKFLSFNTFGGGTQSISDPGIVDYTYTPTGQSQTTNGPSNSYVQTPAIALSQTSPSQISMAAVVEQFPSNSAAYNARTFTIPVPSAPVTYYVTIQDTAQLGDAGTTLTPFCETNTSKVGVPGYTYIGFVVANTVPASAQIGPGGWPPPQLFLVNGQ